ncbi:MAG: DUF86 domain-containing protein [Firmicutes bacterium]|nr:DUF86 domain-containing protein [Bacillota bacterium]
MNHRDKIILVKIISELNIALELISDTSQDDFTDNEMQKRAVSMTVINIGELVKSVTNETRTQYPEIAWREAAGFRDIAAHAYQTLNMGDVYNTVLNDFPKFKQQIQEILLDID